MSFRFVTERPVSKMKPTTVDGAKPADLWVDANGVATRVLCWGQPIDENDNDRNPKKLVLFVCGNPGITEFYEKFLQEIHRALDVPVWVVSHAGTFSNTISIEFVFGIV